MEFVYERYIFMYNICRINKWAKILKNLLKTAFTMFAVSSNAASLKM